MEPPGDLVAGGGHMLGGTVALGHCRGCTIVFSMHYELSCVGARCSDVGRPKVLQHERRDDQCIGAIGDPVSLSQAKKATNCKRPRGRTWGETQGYLEFQVVFDAFMPMLISR